jgi:nicotinate phosphoribosyltransferase
MNDILNPSPLLTDLYQLTMLQSYLDHDLLQNAEFEFFVRDLPHSRNFLIAAGLAQVLEYLENLRFSAAELEWLSTLPYFDKSFIDYLERFRFEGSVYAMPEGTVFFPGEPILRVSAPIPQAQLVETRIINILHFQTMIASKAVRSVIAAPDKLIIDFGLRRAHGAEAGLFAARASYLAGFSGTSTVLAGKLYNIPLYGTMAHSYIQAHDSEEKAFRNFMNSQPGNVVLLIDTYDLMAAIKNVIKMSKENKVHINAIRLDSGDLAKNSKQIRRILDAQGLTEIKIFASGNLDENALKKFARVAAPIDGFGVGTLMITSADAPYLECGYKLVSYAGKPRFKKSPRKATQPCAKQVYRYFNDDGSYAYDEITPKNEQRSARALIQKVMENGRSAHKESTLAEIRAAVKSEMTHLPAEIKSLDRRVTYPVKISRELTKFVVGK